MHFLISLIVVLSPSVLWSFDLNVPLSQTVVHEDALVENNIRGKFNFETDDQQVCRGPVDDALCLPRAVYGAGVVNLSREFPVENIDLVAAAKQQLQFRQNEDSKTDVSLDLSQFESMEDFYGHIFQSGLGNQYAVETLSDEQLNFIVKRFSKLEIRNIATPKLTDENLEEFLNPDTKEIRVPLYYDLTYKGKGFIKPQVTLHIVAHWSLNASAPSGENATGFQTRLETFSDSNTGSNIDALRFVETGVRKYMFWKMDEVAVIGSGKTDQRTIELIESIVTPVVVREVIGLPVALSIFTFIHENVKSLIDGVSEMAEKVIEGIEDVLK